jgi:glycosyltransferase involved in cell wall biosynthesis
VKICLIARSLPNHRLGGLEFHTRDLAAALASRGHSVTVITSAAPLQNQFESEEAFETIFLKSGSPANYSFQLFKGVNGELNRLLLSRNFDVVHAQEYAALFMRAATTRVPLVCTIHGTMFSEVPLYRDYFARLSLADKAKALWQHKQRILLHPIFLQMLKRADALLCDSEFTYRELMRLNDRASFKTTIIPLGLDFSRYSPPQNPPAFQPGDKLKIAILGRLQEQKGIGIALKAIQIAHARGVPVELHIAGSGEYAATVESTIKEELKEIVFTHGRISQDKLSTFLSSCHILLFPDLTQPAFGLVAVEAMLHGLPVIGARSGAIPEVVNEESGWIYDPWSAAELAGLLQRIQADPEQLQSKALAARQRSRNYTSSAMAEKTESIYIHMLEHAAKRL